MFNFVSPILASLTGIHFLDSYEFSSIQTDGNKRTIPLSPSCVRVQALVLLSQKEIQGETGFF